MPKQIQSIKKRVIPVLRKNGIKRAGIFGSYAKGTQRRKSDIDIIIELPKGIGFGFAGIRFELEKALKKKVDLVTYSGLSPHLKHRILNEEVKIL